MRIFSGCDIVAKSRIAHTWQRYGNIFVRRILTPKEIADFQVLSEQQKIRFLALRFAAKEACFKALGTGLRLGISWQDVEIQKDNLGKPVFTVRSRAAERYDQLGIIAQDLSLADEKDYVLATCNLLGDICV